MSICNIKQRKIFKIKLYVAGKNNSTVKGLN